MLARFGENVVGFLQAVLEEGNLAPLLTHPYVLPKRSSLQASAEWEDAE